MLAGRFGGLGYSERILLSFRTMRALAERKNILKKAILVLVSNCVVYGRMRC